jgi:hypothetical protein
MSAWVLQGIEADTGRATRASAVERLTLRRKLNEVLRWESPLGAADGSGELSLETARLV